MPGRAEHLFSGWASSQFQSIALIPGSRLGTDAVDIEAAFGFSCGL